MAIDRLELTAPNDLYYDYCLWQYPPIAPAEGKLRCRPVPRWQDGRATASQLSAAFDGQCAGAGQSRSAVSSRGEVDGCG